MVKRKRDTKTLEEIEEMCFCYYCEREFLDNKSLQDHMKSKHLQCQVSSSNLPITHDPHPSPSPSLEPSLTTSQLCRKKLDSIGGLNVHMDSVHKQPLDKILNALPSREAANGPEIYLMCGVPQDMLDSFKARIYQRYLGPEMQHRQQTGNYLTGSEEAMHAAKKPKVEETPEQLKARRDAHVAQRRAEIAARKAAEANGVQVKQESGVQVKQESGVQVKQESGDSFAAQESHIKLENYPAQEVSCASLHLYPASTDVIISTSTLRRSMASPSSTRVPRRRDSTK